MPTVEIATDHDQYVRNQLNELGLETDTCPTAAVLQTVCTKPIGDNGLPLADTSWVSVGFAVTPICPIGENKDLVTAHVNSIPKQSTTTVNKLTRRTLVLEPFPDNWATTLTDGPWKTITHGDKETYKPPKKNDLWSLQHNAPQTREPHQLSCIWRQNTEDDSFKQEMIKGDKYGTLTLTEKFLEETYHPDCVVVIIEQMVELFTADYPQTVKTLEGLRRFMILQEESIMFQHFAQPSEPEV